MANMRAIRTRIKSVQSTQQITKAMKMVAVAKLRRTQSGMAAMRLFAEKSQEILDTLLAGDAQYDNPFLTPRAEVRCVCYVLFVGNRGLCGIYNSAVLRYLEERLHQDGRTCSVVICGRWGSEVFAHSTLPIVHTFPDMSDTPTMEQALELSEYLKRMYLSGEADEIHLVYQHYRSVLQQMPTALQLLPAAPEAKNEAANDYLFEPDQAAILENVMQLYLNNTVYAVMLEAKTGEHAARMTAMNTATDATAELIDELRLKLNRARQNAITTEISEIVGGASALKKRE